MNMISTDVICGVTTVMIGQYQHRNYIHSEIYK